MHNEYLITIIEVNNLFLNTPFHEASEFFRDRVFDFCIFFFFFFFFIPLIARRLSWYKLIPSFLPVLDFDKIVLKFPSTSSSRIWFVSSFGAEIFKVKFKHFLKLKFVFLSELLSSGLGTYNISWRCKWLIRETNYHAKRIVCFYNFMIWFKLFVNEQ